MLLPVNRPIRTLRTLRSEYKLRFSSDLYVFDGLLPVNYSKALASLVERVEAKQELLLIVQRLALEQQGVVKVVDI